MASKIDQYENLSRIGDQWTRLEELFYKQTEKACYAGIAVVWVFTFPAFSNDFSSDFSQDPDLPFNLIYSLACFVVVLILYLSFNLFELGYHYRGYRKRKKAIEEGAGTHIALIPDIRRLYLSIIVFCIVLAGYFMIGKHLYLKVF